MHFRWIRKRLNHLEQTVSGLESIKGALSEEEMSDLVTELKDLYDELEKANNTATRLKNDVELIRSRNQK